MDTFNGITVGVINLLEAVRFLRLDARVYNASSSECFGDAGPVPCNEDTAFRPVSPYATAKAAAHWLVANYRDAYGVHACSGILFNHESPLRPARFVTSKIVRAAVEIARAGGGELRLGNLDISRDWGWAPDYVDAMWRMLQTDTPSDYVIATGEAWSLRAFCARAFEAVGLNMDDHVVSDPALMRPSDIAFGCGDPARAARDLGWRPTLTMPAIVDAMIEAERATGRA
jgi:GDPmannose 4,6-dehydratase